MTKFIDLRSDTVTRPSSAMRRAMAEAEVGDDQYGDDPTVNRLQERMAAMLGKEAALFVPSGTMANQIAVNILTRPGDEVVVGDELHLVAREAGAAAANSGVQFAVAGSGGLFTAEDFRAVYKPPRDMLAPPTGLVVVENTHNRGGGMVFPQADAIAIVKEAHALGVRAYLDGARLFNAAAASGLSVAELAIPFDVVSVALSKGLGCPIGSVIAGSKDDMARAMQSRRRFGGALRQAGILAAAGLYALDHNVARLPQDHAHARIIAERLAVVPGVVLDLDRTQTNIVICRLAPQKPDAAAIAKLAREAGVLVTVFGQRIVRAVTHMDVTVEECTRAADIVAGIIGEA